MINGTGMESTCPEIRIKNDNFTKSIFPVILINIIQSSWVQDMPLNDD